MENYSPTLDNVAVYEFGFANKIGNATPVKIEEQIDIETGAEIFSFKFDVTIFKDDDASPHFGAPLWFRTNYLAPKLDNNTTDLDWEQTTESMEYKSVGSIQNWVDNKQSQDTEFVIDLTPPFNTIPNEDLLDENWVQFGIFSTKGCIAGGSGDECTKK